MTADGASSETTQRFDDGARDSARATAGPRRPVLAVILSLAVAMSMVVACSGSESTTGSDCDVLVHWRGQLYKTYLDVLKSQHLKDTDVVQPTRGKSLGTGILEGCAEGSPASSSSPISVYQVASVSPKDAILTSQGTLLLVDGGRVPEPLIRHSS